MATVGLDLPIEVQGDLDAREEEKQHKSIGEITKTSIVASFKLVKTSKLLKRRSLGEQQH